MTGDRLEAFVKVAECGSFSKAAEELFVTATAAIKQINALESKLSLTSSFREQVRALLRAGCKGWISENFGACVDKII